VRSRFDPSATAASLRPVTRTSPTRDVIEIVGAGEGNRTLVISLEGCCSTIELHPHNPYFIGLSASPRPSCRELVGAADHNRFAAHVQETLVEWAQVARQAVLSFFGKSAGKVKTTIALWRTPLEFSVQLPSHERTRNATKPQRDPHIAWRNDHVGKPDGKHNFIRQNAAKYHARNSDPYERVIKKRFKFVEFCSQF
jgi:hypothetical protein